MMRRSIESSRPILATTNSTPMTSRASARLSTASTAPSMATTATTSSLDRNSSTPLDPSATKSTANASAASKTAATSSPYTPAPSAQDAQLPPEMRHYANSLERLNTGTRRLAQEQRYTVSKEKMERMQMLALEARLQKGLDRRLTGQDAAGNQVRGNGSSDPEKAL